MATSVCAVSELLTPVTVEYSGPVPSARPAPPAGRGRWFDDAGAISTGSATLQRSLVAALGACGCRPTGRLWRVAELLTRGSAIAGRRCDQPRPGAPGVRAERLGSGRSPRLLAGNAMAWAAPPGPRARSACLPDRPDRHAGSRATVRAPAPRPPRRISARCCRAVGCTPGRESGVRVGRMRPVPAAASVGPARCVTGWPSPLRITDGLGVAARTRRACLLVEAEPFGVGVGAHPRQRRARRRLHDLGPRRGRRYCPGARGRARQPDSRPAAVCATADHRGVGAGTAEPVAGIAARGR